MARPLPMTLTPKKKNRSEKEPQNPPTTRVSILGPCRKAIPWENSRGFNVGFWLVANGVELCTVPKIRVKGIFRIRRHPGVHRKSVQDFDVSVHLFKQRSFGNIPWLLLVYIRLFGNFKWYNFECCLLLLHMPCSSTPIFF